ncbi:MAG: amino acid ABC transporter ATP-binding protein [Gammaproteobacteria bacterium]
MSSVNAKIVVRDLKKSFESRAVLKGVSFSVDHSDVVALLGGSGSGKSTLLRCIGLLEKPEAGCLRVDNIDLIFSNQKQNDGIKKKLRKKIGMVFQQFNLWPHMTILQNIITAPMNVLKLSKHDAIEEAEKMLLTFGLIDKKNTYPAYLSGGQKQRIAIIRALMMKPEILLLDEPTSALDPEMVFGLLGILKKLVEDRITLIIATHEIEFAAQCSNKTIFFGGGQIIEFGETLEILKKPKTEAFSKFLSSVL